MLICVLALGLLGSCIGQKLVVTHAPAYVTFQEQEKPLPTGDLSKLISHTLGVPSQSELQWKGLRHGSVFQRPKANVLVTVLTSEIQPGLTVKSKAEFPVDMDSAVDVDGLMSMMQGKFMERRPLTVDTELDNSVFDVRSEFDVFHKIPNTMRKMADRLLDQDSVAQQHHVGALNTSVHTDLSLLGELQVVQDVLDTVKTDGSFMDSKTPDVYSFTITGLKGISDKHGPKSPKAEDATTLVSSFLNKMTEQFKTLYKNNVVVEILLVNPPPQGLVRKVRSLKAVDNLKGPVTNLTGANIATTYDDSYPVAFNIILWFMIIWAVVVYAVCYGIWNLDPGRDSIIYRMTTTRLKKD